MWLCRSYGTPFMAFPLKMEKYYWHSSLCLAYMNFVCLFHFSWNSWHLRRPMVSLKVMQYNLKNCQQIKILTIIYSYFIRVSFQSYLSLFTCIQVTILSNKMQSCRVIRFSWIFSLILSMMSSNTLIIVFCLKGLVWINAINFHITFICFGKKNSLNHKTFFC